MKERLLTYITQCPQDWPECEEYRVLPAARYAVVCVRTYLAMHLPSSENHKSLGNIMIKRSRVSKNFTVPYVLYFPLFILCSKSCVGYFFSPFRRAKVLSLEIAAAPPPPVKRNFPLPRPPSRRPAAPPLLLRPESHRPCVTSSRLPILPPLHTPALLSSRSLTSPSLSCAVSVRPPSPITLAVCSGYLPVL